MKAGPGTATSRYILAFAATGSALAGGCGKPIPVEPPGPPVLTLVSGNRQIGFAGEMLPAAVVVSLVRAGGEPAQGLPLQFRPIEGPVLTVSTSYDGRASYDWRLGNSYNQVLEISYTAPDGERSSVTATAIARPRTPSLTVVSGEGQTGYIDDVLLTPIIVALAAFDGAPLAGEPIVFNPSDGQAVTIGTDSGGTASFRWRLGERYDQRVVATHTPEGGPSVSVSVTARSFYRYREPVDDLEFPPTHAESLGVDTASLVAMIDAIRRGDYPRIHSVWLAKNGRLFMSESFPREGETPYTGTDSALHYVASVSKSFTSTLVGIAIDQGLIASLDQSLYSFFPEYDSFANWSDSKDSITLRDALLMRAGLRCSDDGSWETTPDFVRTTLDLPMNETPGTAWRYCSILTHVIGSAVANVAGMNLADFAQTHLWDPLGVTDIRWTFSPVGRAVTGYGFWMRPIDMVRFGQMILNGGSWRGQRVVSEDWLREATTGAETGLGGDLYGYQWWVRRVVHEGTTRLVPYAAGDGGQLIFILRDDGIVAVFTGGNYGTVLSGQPVELLERYVIPALP